MTPRDRGAKHQVTLGWEMAARPHPLCSPRRSLELRCLGALCKSLACWNSRKQTQQKSHLVSAPSSSRKAADPVAERGCGRANISSWPLLCCVVPAGKPVLSRRVLRNDGRGETNQLVNTASEAGWESFQTEILALLLWHFLSWLKSELFSSTCTESKKKIYIYCLFKGWSST